MASNDVKQLLEDLKKENSEQQQAMQEAIRKEMAKNPIKYENLDNNLKNLIMAKDTSTSGSASVPKNPMKEEKGKSKDSKILINDTFQKVCDDLIMKNNVYLYGKAGTGKNSRHR